MKNNELEKFLDFVKKTFPNRKVDMKQQNDGSTSVSLTTTSQNQANNDSAIFTCLVDCITNCRVDGWVSSNECTSYCSNRCGWPPIPFPVPE